MQHASSPLGRVHRVAAALLGSLLLCSAFAQPPVFDAALRERIDAFVESERRDSGIPGIALAIVQEGQPAHVRGFGHDGRGQAITGDTPFPIGSLTKSFTALVGAPGRRCRAAGGGRTGATRYLPVVSRSPTKRPPNRITLRHLLNQTSGLSHAPTVSRRCCMNSDAGIEATARGLARVSLKRPVGERFEYSNLNFVLLGAVLQAATGPTVADAGAGARVPATADAVTATPSYDAARRAGMTAVHRLWFGWPVAHDVALPPGFAPTGSLVASARRHGALRGHVVG